jgi:hypothetical protein
VTSVFFEVVELARIRKSAMLCFEVMMVDISPEEHGGHGEKGIYCQEI